MRLNKYIAHSGLCSRRKADELIKNGNVRINNNIVKDLFIHVEAGEEVFVNNRKVSADNKQKIYILLNKPVGFVTTLKDEKNRATVIDLLTDIDERVFPVGRLDYNTSGLLLLTNDGEFAQKISHPKNEIYKTYHALVAGKISREKVMKLRNGIDIGGFKTSKAFVKVLREKNNSSIVEIKIKEGKNRQVRKMFAAVGNEVQHLQRTAIGEIYLGRLKEGHYRKLSKKELDYLNSI